MAQCASAVYPSTRHPASIRALRHPWRADHGTRTLRVEHSCCFQVCRTALLRQGCSLAKCLASLLINRCSAYCSACSQACKVFSNKQARVIGPTPPGTGVIQAARLIASSKPTSPINWPLSWRLMPTSMTIAPGLIHSPLTKLAIPTATTTKSARRTWLSRSLVKRWVMVVVQPASNNSSAIGRPTILDAPTITASKPCKSTPVCSPPTAPQIADS